MANHRPVGKHNIGILLAIMSGLILLWMAIWPMVSLSSPAPWTTWAIALVVGVGFLASAFLTDRSVTLAKAILVIGAGVLFVSGLLSTTWFDSASGWLGFVTAMVPAALGLIAALTIGRIEPEKAP